MTLELFSSTTSQHYNPGPGAYNTDPYRTIGGPLSLKYSIKPVLKSSLRESITAKVDFMPLRKTVDTLPKKFTIAPRYPESNSKGTVGPSYLPDSDYQRKQAFTIKSRYPDTDATNTPGPGAYDPRELSKTQPPPMGSRPAIVLSDPTCSPGPAAYNVSRELGDNSLKFSIRPITAPSIVEREDPGYVYNNPMVPGDDQPKYTLSKASIPRDYFNDVPGPGTYQPKEPHAKSGIGRSIHTRIPPSTLNTLDVPYENTRRFPDSRPTTIHRCCGREYWTRDTSIPGPNWVPDSTLDRGKIHFLGKREVSLQKESGQTPGPCTYNPTNPTRHSEPLFTFKGPASRDDWLPRDKNIPGPGQYSIKQGNNLPKWTIGERSISQARQRAQTAAATNRNSKPQPSQRSLAKTSFK